MQKLEMLEREVTIASKGETVEGSRAGLGMTFASYFGQTLAASPAAKTGRRAKLSVRLSDAAAAETPLDEALREVDRERHLQELRRRIDVALAGYVTSPFDASGRW